MDVFTDELFGLWSRLELRFAPKMADEFRVHRDVDELMRVLVDGSGPEVHQGASRENYVDLLIKSMTPFVTTQASYPTIFVIDFVISRLSNECSPFFRSVLTLAKRL